MKNKLLTMVLLGFLANILLGAQDAFEFVNSPDGYSYLRINQDVDSFKISISGYGEAAAHDNPSGKWGEGHFKYFTYRGDIQREVVMAGHGYQRHATTILKDSATSEIIEPTAIAKGTEIVDFGSLAAGTKIGFAFDDRGTDEWSFKFTDSGLYQKGGSRYYTYNAADDEMLVNFGQMVYSGFSKNNLDDWMVISVSATASAGTPSGAPLPGALAVLLVGGVGAGAFAFGKKRKRS